MPNLPVELTLPGTTFSAYMPEGSTPADVLKYHVECKLAAAPSITLDVVKAAEERP